jgi:hypothetical protein
MLAEAFTFDPMQEWLFPNLRTRHRRLQRLYRLDVEHRLNGRAEIHHAAGAGVAFWHPPGSDSTVPGWSALRIAPSLASVVLHHPMRSLHVLRNVVTRRPDGSIKEEPDVGLTFHQGEGP